MSNLKSYDEMNAEQQLAYRMGYDAALANRRRLDPPFPTDEDVEVAARAIEQAGWNAPIDDPTWVALKANHSGEYAEMLAHARAALVAVAKNRKLPCELVVRLLVEAPEDKEK